MDELKARYDRLVREHDLAVARNEQAEQALAEVVRRIKDAYGVSSLAEAEVLLAKMQAEVDELTQRIKTELDKAQS